MNSSLIFPAFGQADLSNCEREQIQIPGSIQPHGALLVVREPDLTIIQASSNAEEFMGVTVPIAGRSLADVPGNLAERIVPHLGQPLRAIPLAVRCEVGAESRPVDALLHRPPEGGLVVELEPAGPPLGVAEHVEHALTTVVACSTLRSLCDESARIFKALTGYDRVMIYRFDDAGHGEVLSESKEPELESYLGNRYPASDIPQIARRLYERNRVRLLVDVNYEPVPLVPSLSPLTGRELDMSLCFLRSMSPIHTQYLKNMGVRATLVASLMVGNKLWGLVACHHYSPRVMHYGTRAVCELYAEIIATRVVALESFVQVQAELSVRRLEQRMLETIARDGDWKNALFDRSRALLEPLRATGAALVFENEILSAGEVPGTGEIRDLCRWLDMRPRFDVFATASLSIDEPALQGIAAVASGLVAATVSTSPGEYLLWFRPERVRTVTWAGDPNKPMQIGNNPADLSPRRSFAQWHQVVERTAESWSIADLTAGRLIGESVTDVVLQFRAVRMLIAQNQLSTVTRQIRDAGVPTVVVDTMGRILIANGAFERLFGKGRGGLSTVLDIAGLFDNSADVRNALQEMLSHRRSWRGEVTLRKSSADEARAFLVRADPVYSAPDVVLGFVMLMSDLTEAKEADAARRRFQEGVIDRHHMLRSAPDSKDELLFRNLLVSVFGNAQLAALEITDGMDAGRMPDMLDSVRASLNRTAQLLEYLVWHSGKVRAVDRRG